MSFVLVRWFVKWFKAGVWSYDILMRRTRMKHTDIRVWSRFTNPILAAGGISYFIAHGDLASCIYVPYQCLGGNLFSR